MPAFESRRVRTQPLTVTGPSCGAWPARIARTLNSLLSIDRHLLRQRALSSADALHWRVPQQHGMTKPRGIPPGPLLKRGWHAPVSRELCLVGSEAVEQAVTARASQIRLAAAALRATRRVRRIPRPRRGVIAQAFAVDVPDHRGTLGAACPVAAGPVLARREGTPIHLRAGQNVVIVRCVADAGDDGAALGQRRRHAELVVVAVEIVDVLGHHFALEVLPRPLADAITGVDGLRTARSLGAQIGAPGLAACARTLRQRLAVTIRALEPAEVRAFPGTGAGHEKGHIRRLRRLLSIRAGTQSE